MCYFALSDSDNFGCQVIDALYAGVHNNAISNYMAFYSSELGGIVTDPALMIVSVDDHMVHRGHAVFDTATLTKGYLYQLDDHLDRFYSSASKAALTPPFPRNQIRRIILETAAATKCFEGASASPSLKTSVLSQPHGCV